MSKFYVFWKRKTENPPLKIFFLIPNVINIIKLVAVNPATSETIKRTFSFARNLKTWLRSTMLPARFNYLALVKFHRANWQPESTKCCKWVCQQGDSTKPIWTFHWLRFLLYFLRLKAFLPRPFHWRCSIMKVFRKFGKVFERYLRSVRFLFYHSHKKLKDSLETRAEPAVFSL